MFELYLISVLGELKEASYCTQGLSFFLFLVLLVVFTMLVVQSEEDDIEADKCIKAVKFYCFKITLPILVLSTLIRVFTPTSKELYLIFGVGTVIDYFQSSKEAKALPENTLKLINTTLEKWSLEMKSDSTATDDNKQE